jgi:hypothetical protein
MSVLSIHETSIDNNHVTVTAVVEDMCLYAEQLATTLINGVQAFVQHLLNWLTTNRFLLTKLVSAAILIGLTPSGNLLTPLTIN